MAVYKIPLVAGPQEIGVDLPTGSYRLRVIYCDAPEAGWILDISDAENNLILCGVPLVTGCDLLAQHRHLGILDGPLYVATDGDLTAPPTFGSLGVSSHLYLEV